MKKQLLMFMMFLPAILYTALAHADAVYYVQSVNASVRAEPSFGAKVIAKVAKGQTLASISKQGSWIKIKVDGKEGYISSLLVSSHPPMQKQTVIKAEDEEIKPTARRRASSYTSAAAARGLTNEEKQREGVEETSDYKALDKMEAQKVTPEEVSKFKESGK
jgi:uncharacterized protein YgiM (DUF1202 family)